MTYYHGGMYTYCDALTHTVTYYDGAILFAISGTRQYIVSGSHGNAGSSFNVHIQ